MSKPPKRSPRKREDDPTRLHSLADLGQAFGIPVVPESLDLVRMSFRERSEYLEGWKTTSWRQRAEEQMWRLHTPHEQTRETLNILTDVLILEALEMTEDQMRSEGVESIKCVGPIGIRREGKETLSYPQESDSWANLYRGYAFSPLIYINFEGGKMQSTLRGIIGNTQGAPEQIDQIRSVKYVQDLLNVNPFVRVVPENNDNYFNRLFKESLAFMEYIRKLKETNANQSEDSGGIKTDLRFRALYDLKDRVLSSYMQEAENQSRGAQIVLREDTSEEAPFVPADRAAHTALRRYWDVHIVNTFGDMVHITWRGDIDIDNMIFTTARGVRAKIPTGATIITADDPRNIPGMGRR